MKLYNDDCINVLKTLSDESIDSLVTDPPYGLSDPPNIIDVLTHWINDKDYKHNTTGFMNKEWDSFVPNPSYWKEVYRVLKPGGHGLVFAGTRTIDLMGMSLRLAGFEIRDMLGWITSQGFPKSLNISKAIDKSLGLEQEIIGQNETILKKQAADFRRGKRKIVDSLNNGNSERNNGFVSLSANITKPNSELAQQFYGYGTALKPAIEPIILIRKPLSEKTIVKNIMKYGTGGLNINDSRIPFSENDDVRIDKNCNHKAKAGLEEGTKNNTEGEPQQLYNTNGRYPSNIIHDGSDIVLNSFNKLYNDSNEKFYKCCLVEEKDYLPLFYSSKTSSKERNSGCINNHPTVKPISLMKYLCKLVTPDNGIILDPFMGSGSTGIGAITEGFDFIGIELDENYFKIATSRIDYHIKNDNFKNFFTEGNENATV